MTTTPDDALEFVRSVPIIGPPEVGGLESMATGPTFRGDEQAIVIGSQIAEFARNVPQALRAPVSHSLLLAQLAANKSVEGGGSSQDWYTKYFEVLESIGWIAEQGGDSMSVVTGTSAEVHEAIIPLVAAAFGGAAAAALIVPLLEGLKKMDENSPWITLFQRESQRIEANQFQVSHVHSPDGAAPKMVLVGFGVEASKSLTQVLFFKFSGDNAVLTHANAHLSMDATVFAGIGPALQAKVGSHVATFVADVEI